MTDAEDFLLGINIVCPKHVINLIECFKDQKILIAFHSTDDLGLMLFHDRSSLLVDSDGKFIIKDPCDAEAPYKEIDFTKSVRKIKVLFNITFNPLFT